MDALTVTSDAAAATGVYLHVPFCRSRCIYCDFFSTTCGHDVQERYADAVAHELKMRFGSGEPRPAGTLYVGGGTPSVLTPAVRRQLFAAIHRHFTLVPGAEVTLEANPDDVTPDLCAELHDLGVNRVSLGVQTFDDRRLRFLHRRHTAAQAIQAVETLVASGIGNVSIDLIFGLPGQRPEAWRRDVVTALGLPIKHLSAYALMFEDGTPLTRLRDTGRIREVDEETSLDMFGTLLDLTAGRMEHYEISNYAVPGFRSRHNSSYWNGTPYVGLGPGAHSFDGRAYRRANLPHLRHYLAARDLGTDVPHTDEHLTKAERLDERVFTALRTTDGLDLAAVGRDCGAAEEGRLRRTAAPYVAGGQMTIGTDGHLRLTRRGIFVSDAIMADFMEANA